VAVPLVDHVLAVELVRTRAGRQPARIRAEPHRAAQVVDAEQVTQLVDDVLGRVGGALGGIGLRQAAYVAGEFDGCPLEAVADAEVGDAALARDLGGAHHAARPAVAEAPGDEDPAGAVEQVLAAGRLEGLGLDPLDVHAQPVLETAVVERLVQALVRILVPDVLADDVNRDLVGRVLDAVDEVRPRVHSRLGSRQVQALEEDAVEPFARQHERHLVDARDVLRGDHGFLVHVAEEGDLALDLLIEEAIGAAEQDVGLDADCAQVAHAVLRRLGLEFPAAPMNGTSVRWM
jgi:hypothetical protein